MDVSALSVPITVAVPVDESLDLVPHHRAIPEIQRLVFPGIPYLTSVHHISDAEAGQRDYCEPHHHDGEIEVNLFLGTTSDFRFRVMLDGAEHILGPIAAIAVPAGETHAANVVSGSGYYVVLKATAPAGDRAASPVVTLAHD